MSTRWYPLYQKGNPQLRVFLPNFWMKLVRNPHMEKDDVLPNRVQFHVSMGMSRHDIKNYLLNIYNVPAVDVRIYTKMGATKLVGKRQMVVKEDDYKVALVTLPEGTTFQFPDLHPEDKHEKDLAELKKIEKEAKTIQKLADSQEMVKPGLPGWFGMSAAFKISAPKPKENEENESDK